MPKGEAIPEDCGVHLQVTNPDSNRHVLHGEVCCLSLVKQPYVSLLRGEIDRKEQYSESSTWIHGTRAVIRSMTCRLGMQTVTELWDTAAPKMM